MNAPELLSIKRARRVKRLAAILESVSKKSLEQVRENIGKSELSFVEMADRGNTCESLQISFGKIDGKSIAQTEIGQFLVGKAPTDYWRTSSNSFMGTPAQKHPLILST
jgi:hypothetical protein